MPICDRLEPSCHYFFQMLLKWYLASKTLNDGSSHNVDFSHRLTGEHPCARAKS